LEASSLYTIKSNLTFIRNSPISNLSNAGEISTFLREAIC
jgi:hypothetical protein